VLESRRADGGKATRRRRECQRCGTRFTTFERREPAPRFVRKRGGEREPFDRTKLRAALLRAAHKRPVSPAAVEEVVDEIEADVDAEGGELEAERIGELCLAGLRRLDLGAYLQFATVYRQLADINAIRAELRRLSATSGKSTRSVTSGPRANLRRYRLD
jgi:transcriptional repressor NrdR